MLIRDCALFAVAGVMVLAAPLAALAVPDAGKGGPLIVIGRDPAALVAKAGGRPVGPQSAPFALFAAGDPGLSARLRDSGAWHVASASALASLCGFQ